MLFWKKNSFFQRRGRIMRYAAILLCIALLYLTHIFARHVPDPPRTAVDAFGRKDYAALPRLLAPAVEQGNAEAEARFGTLYAGGMGVVQDSAAAMAWLRAAAEQDYAPARTVIGLMYARGQGAPQDDVQAYMWLTLASHRENTLAAGELATLAKKMTPAQIAAAKDAAAAWRPSGAPPPVLPAKAAGWNAAETAALARLKAAAGRGDATAQYYVGKYYESRNIAEAQSWWRRAAAAGNPDAEYELGNACRWRRELCPGKATGEEWLEKSAEAGDTESMQALYWSIGIEAGHERRLKVFRLAADHGDIGIMENVGLEYDSGPKPDREEAVFWYALARKKSMYNRDFMQREIDNDLPYLSAAQIADVERRVAAWKPLPVTPTPQNSADEFSRLAFNYFTQPPLDASVPQGDDPPAAATVADEGDADVLAAADKALTREDWQAALNLLHPLAERGNAVALERIGRLYADSRVGLEGGWIAARKWLRAAALRGDLQAQFEYGRALSYGWGAPGKEGYSGPADPVGALPWLAMAAKRGSVDAQVHLGEIYGSNNGVPQDYAQSLIYFRMAAEQGNPEAICRIGTMLRFGWGVQKDEAAAAAWYKRAADKNDQGAQQYLGDMYAAGEGVRRDDEEALFWKLLAVRQQNPSTFELTWFSLFSEYGRKASFLQIVHANERARKWKPVEALRQ
jgi:TPR repeat protein